MLEKVLLARYPHLVLTHPALVPHGVSSLVKSAGTKAQIESMSTCPWTHGSSGPHVAHGSPESRGRSCVFLRVFLEAHPMFLPV